MLLPLSSLLLSSCLYLLRGHGDLRGLLLGLLPDEPDPLVDLALDLFREVRGKERRKKRERERVLMGEEEGEGDDDDDDDEARPFSSLCCLCLALFNMWTLDLR